MSFFPLRIHQNRCRLGLRPRSHWGAYSTPPDSLEGFKGAASFIHSFAVGDAGEGRTRGRGQEGMEGKVGRGKEGEQGEVGGSALVFGG